MLNGDQLNELADQQHRQMMTPEYQREQFERGLMSQEQQRRQYDSETARQSQQLQQQKYGVLGGLLRQVGHPTYGTISYGSFGRS